MMSSGHHIRSAGGDKQVKSAYCTGTYESRLAIGALADITGEIYNSQSRESWFECMPGTRTLQCSNSWNYVDGFRARNNATTGHETGLFLCFQHSPGQLREDKAPALVA